LVLWFLCLLQHFLHPFSALLSGTLIFTPAHLLLPPPCCPSLRSGQQWRYLRWNFRGRSSAEPGCRFCSFLVVSSACLYLSNSIFYSRRDEEVEDESRRQR
jgi:hypothetical protein